MSRPAAELSAVRVSEGGGGGGGASQWRVGPAQVIPFPVTRRVAFLSNVVGVASSCRDRGRYLARILKQQEDTMRRKGIAEHVIESELAALERALQARLAEGTAA